MPKVKFEDGTVIRFEGNPSPQDIEEAYASVKGGPAPAAPVAPPATPAAPPPNQLLNALLGAVAPPVQAMRTVQQLPDWAVRPALSTAGGIVGSTSGIPFGLTVGSGVGMAGAEAELMRREAQHGQPTPLPEAIQRMAFSGAGTAGTTLATAGAFNVLSGGVKMLRTIRNVPLRAGFVNNIRQSFLQSKKIAGEAFGQRLDAMVAAHPQQTVNLSGVLADLTEEELKNPTLRSLVARSAANAKESALIQSILSQPETAATLTMQESQMLKQVFQRALKQKFVQISPEYTDAHISATAIWNGIKQAQLQAFPEFQDIAAEYAKQMANFRTIKPYLTKAALEPALMENFGNRAEIQLAVRELLPKETVKQITRFVTAMKFGGRVGKAAIAGASGVGAVEVIRRSVAGR